MVSTIISCYLNEPVTSGYKSNHSENNNAVKLLVQNMSSKERQEFKLRKTLVN